MPTTVGGVEIPAGTTVMVLNGAANRDPTQFDEPGDVRRRPRQRPPAHRVRARRPHVPRCAARRAEARVSIERLLDRTTDIRISEAEHGPAGARRYQYVPTYILRGLTRLHLEFTL